MPGQQRTRKQLRQSIGQITDKVWMDAGDPESSPSETAPNTNKIIDENLEFGSDDEHRGKWLFATDSAGSNHTRRVRASSPTERSLTVSVPFATAPDTAWTYELWDGDLSPIQVHEFIDQSITEADRKGAVPLTQDSFHTGGDIRSWGLSSVVAGVRFAEWRNRYVGEQLESGDNLWSAGDSAGTTVVTDTSEKREGSGSVRVDISSGDPAGEILAQSPTLAFSNRHLYSHMEFWAKARDAISSGIVVVRLTVGATGSSAIEDFTLPALNTDSWQYLSFAMSNRHVSSAGTALSSLDVTRVQLYTTSSTGVASSTEPANSVWLDDFKFVRSRAEEWVTIPRSFWEVDKDERVFRLKADANVPYAKMRLTGVQLPSLLDTDTEVVQIDPSYVFNSAAAKAFRKIGDMSMSDRHESLAQQQRNRMNTPSGVKWVDN